LPLSRRDFLRSVGLAVGGLGLTAGGYERLIPYVNQPEDIVPGVATWYATSCRECPAGCGMIVRNRDSHAVKCEGNPSHPISKGTLCARGQAAPMGLYDPDRVPNALRRTGAGLDEVAWDEALKELGGTLAGKKIAFLSDLQTGSMEALIRAWLAAFGSDHLTVWEPLDYAPVKAAFGVVPTFDIASCDYLISFGADFLENWISPVEYARGFAAMRQVRDGTRAGFAYVGPRISATAANADVRIIVPPGAEVEVARAIASGKADEVAAKYGIDPRDIERVADGIKRAKSPLVLPGWYAESAEAVKILGGDKSPAVHRNRPHAVTGIGGRDRIDALVKDMESGAVDALFVLNANPAYALPESARFAEAMKRVPVVVSLSSFMDETAALAHWVLPSNTPLESWGDYEPYPDVRNLMQPAMGQVFDTKHTGDILIELARAAGRNPRTAFKAESFYEFLRSRWGFPLKPGDTADTPAPEWEALLQGGYGKELRVTNYELRVGEAHSLPPIPYSLIPSPSLRLHAFPHIYYYDGRGANRRWLQEIPEPVTNAVWGTWAEMHPETARKLGIGTDDVIEIEADGAKIETSAYVWDGAARDTVAIPIGEGHTDYGRFASGVGANVFSLLDKPSPVVTIRRTGEKKWATRVKGSSDQSGREIVQTADLAKPLERNREIIMPLPSGYKRGDFYPGHEYKKHRWAMVIDLDRCIGCHACVTACYAENNLGVVGAEEIYRRREMSWLRIDRYIDWRERSSPILFQPMLCQQCDAAPCEPVCPVFASSHSDEGLNMQVYNRCVGTRYCSHNCPYKVRRFNWYDWQWPEPLNWQLNPDVTVRCRGVMEKCTFCIQRIREVEIVALRENRKVEDGEVTPACVQTCPTGAFTFGDLMDKNSRVSKLIDTDPRAYQVLAELNTKPAVIYLKRVVDDL
jgi:anaerobic selenocysteine-containing dehydrogenase/Fe-S-cluster-containing dehydrogenase component